jgi:hypothetical protein
MLGYSVDQASLTRNACALMSKITWTEQSKSTKVDLELLSGAASETVGTPTQAVYTARRRHGHCAKAQVNAVVQRVNHAWACVDAIGHAVEISVGVLHLASADAKDNFVRMVRALVDAICCAIAIGINVKRATYADSQQGLVPVERTLVDTIGDAVHVRIAAAPGATAFSRPVEAPTSVNAVRITVLGAYILV